MATLEPEPGRQVRIIGEMVEADIETSVNYLKMLANKRIC